MRSRTYSYLTDEKKESIIKRKLKYEHFKHCLAATRCRQSLRKSQRMHKKKIIIKISAKIYKWET